MAGIVVADAGPLIAFAVIDELSILQQLFSSIVITDSVRDECLAKSGPDAERIKAAIETGWLVVETVATPAPPLSPRPAWELVKVIRSIVPCKPPMTRC